MPPFLAAKRLAELYAQVSELSNNLLVPPQTSMKNMEKELLCPVCQEMYKQPLVLPCTHNVCQACAREVLGQQGYIGHGGDPSSEPTSPASTPSTRSPRLSRRTLPKPDRLDRLLKSGGHGVCGVGGNTERRKRVRDICRSWVEYLLFIWILMRTEL